jgi:hypothetical protein
MQDLTDIGIETVQGGKGRSLSTGIAPDSISTGSVSGSRHASSLATAGSWATGEATESLSLSRHRPLRTGVLKGEAKYRHKARALFEQCLKEIDAAIADENEFFLRNNALENLKDCLSALWAMRQDREEGFAESVNMLQCVLLKRHVEEFENRQLVVLRSAFEKLCSEPVLDDEIVNGITVELLRGGIDVFREIT